ncbi:MAG: hypothetical protein ABIH11_02995 [Candidatus Altiarchaeota archaeon]
MRVNHFLLKKTILLLSLAILFSNTAEAVVCEFNADLSTNPNPQSDPYCEECRADLDCFMCPGPFYFHWPVDSLTTPVNVINSSCYSCQRDSDNIGHQGVDLIQKDGDIVRAVWEGKAYRYDLGATGGEPAGSYQCGCGIRFVTEPVPPNNIVYTIFYCHLLDDGRAPNGFEAVKGDTLGYSGGGQPDEKCRGSSPSPRLYFEVRTKGTTSPVSTRSEGKAVDIFSCMPDSCRYWYTNKTNEEGRICDPTEPPGASGVSECKPICNWKRDDCQWPSYTSGPGCYSSDDNTRDKKWYAKVNITDYGKLDVEGSEVYDYNGDRVTTKNDKSAINDFIKIIKVNNKGELKCGKVVGTNVQYNTNNCKDILSLMVEDGVFDKSLALTDLMFRLDFAGENENKKLFVGSEYVMLGVDEEDHVDKMDLTSNPSFRPYANTYELVYVLARSCDVGGRTKITRLCKDKRLRALNRSMDYEDHIKKGEYTYCEWNLFDAGKYYDTPDVYTKAYESSRMMADTGLKLTETITDLEDVERFNEGTYDLMHWWNSISAERLQGHDLCNEGDLSCTLGSSTPGYLGFIGETGTPPYYPEVGVWEPGSCMELSRYERGYGYWSEHAADYFGFDDRQENRHSENPKFQDYDSIQDGKYDKESGMPDKDYVNRSIFSIKTRVWAHFVTKVTWKSPAHKVHLYDEGGDDIDWQIWLMPCDENAPWTCRWEPTEITCKNRTQSRVCRNNNLDWCAKCPGSGSDWWTAPNTIYPCSGHGTIIRDCYKCSAQDGGTGEECGDFCCWGGVKVDDEHKRSTVLAYYPEDWPYFMGGNFVEMYRDEGVKVETPEVWPAVQQGPLCPDTCGYPLRVPPNNCPYKSLNEPNDDADLQ